MTSLKTLTAVSRKQIPFLYRQYVSGSTCVLCREQHSEAHAKEDFKDKTDTDFLIEKLMPEPYDMEPYMIRTFGEKLPRPKPFDYENKWYGSWAKLVDQTIWRMDRNSKVILVEGGVASGKTLVAEKIAHEFDLKYFPSATCDDIFIVDGLDLRELNYSLPKRIQHYDIDMFLSDNNPHEHMPGSLQIAMFGARVKRYARGMLHLLSTGQGIVLERPPQADVIFAKILNQLGYLSDPGLKFYTKLYKRVMINFMPAHLTVYLDTPVDLIKQYIKKRNLPQEVNSQVLNDEFLEAYNHYAKSSFLYDVERTGESITVDASGGLDLEGIVDDIANTDLATHHSDFYTKFHMWKFTSEDELSYFRHIAQDEQFLHRIITPGQLELFKAPELHFTTEEAIAYREAIHEYPLMKYVKGYFRNHESVWKLMLKW